MGFFRTIQAQMIVLLITIVAFIYFVNKDLKATGQISIYTWFFVGIIILNAVKLYAMWKMKQK